MSKSSTSSKDDKSNKSSDEDYSNENDNEEPETKQHIGTNIKKQPQKVQKKEHKNYDSEDENDSDNERTKIRGELSSMSFEDLMKLKEELGSKVYNEAIFGPKIRSKVVTKTDYKRENKNRPREMSSKRPVPLFGNIKKKTEEMSVRDPRFDVKCGEYDSRIFKKNYDFINDIREKEITELKEKYHTEKSEDEKARIKFLIQRLENKNREERRRKLKEEVLTEEHEEIKKAREEGKKPHYNTKKERRTKELVKQFEELKKTGKLQKHLEKRRKKNASKDRKKLNFD